MLGLFLVFVLVAVAYVRLKLRGASLYALALKALTTVLCIAMAVCAAHMQTHVSAWAMVVVLALVCGLLGDVFLDLKLVYPQDGAWFTHAGFVSFGIGHVGYWLYFFSQYQWRMPMLAVWALVVALALWLVLASEKPLGLDYGRFRPITAVYTVLLVGAWAQAGMLWWLDGGLILAVLALALLLFVVSDAILSQSYFGLRPEQPWMVVGNYLFYYGAQVLVAWSLLWAPPPPCLQAACGL